jgi:nicotinamide riboside kinase
MRQIAIVGPESSGKTTLCEALATHYEAPFVEECARGFLTDQGGTYVEDDLRTIAMVQHDAAIWRTHQGWLQHQKAHAFMFPEYDPFSSEPPPVVRIPEMPLMLHDTDMITIRIWAQEKFGRVHPEIEQLVQETHYDHWLLCRPDMPWEPDPLRENPHDRDRLFDVYELTLKELSRPYTIIEGDHERRMRTAIAMIDVLIQGDPIKEREAD